MSHFNDYSKDTLSLNGVENPIHQSDITNCISMLYCSSLRRYHMTGHITSMFRTADKLGLSLSPSEKLAILFHDVIYVTGQHDNEGRSIDFMIALMAGYGVPLTEWCWASRCIRETANFMNYVEDESTHMVLDLDLASLADPFDDFMDTNELIMEEFKANHGDRIKFLSGFLNKDKIFYRLTDLEPLARNNIERYTKEYS